MSQRAHCSSCFPLRVEPSSGTCRHIVGRGRTWWGARVRRAPDGGTASLPTSTRQSDNVYDQTPSTRLISEVQTRWRFSKHRKCGKACAWYHLLTRVFTPSIHLRAQLFRHMFSSAHPHTPSIRPHPLHTHTRTHTHTHTHTPLIYPHARMHTNTFIASDTATIT
jgi:hypothetical protein